MAYFPGLRGEFALICAGSALSQIRHAAYNGIRPATAESRAIMI